MKKRIKKIVLGTILLAVLTAAGIVTMGKINENKVCAVSVYDKTVCYVDNPDVVAETSKILLNKLKAKGSDIKAYNAGDCISIETVTPQEGQEIITDPKEAAKLLKKAVKAKKGDKKRGIRIVSTGTETKTFTPETEYRQDPSMYAGRSWQESESRDGKKEYFVTYTTVNGKVTNKDEELIQVLDEGEPAVIYRGTLGLPEGADWKTYEGEPAPAMGNALLSTALGYRGIPYSKWDCVDLVRHVYMARGITLPRSHKGIQNFGYGVSYANAQPGDIICYKRHVGIYMGNGKMVHSTSKSGVSIGKIVPSKIVAVRRYVGN